MKYPIEYHPEVENDLRDALDYYNLQREGLGDEFLLAVEATINYIQRQPLHFQKLNRNTRKANIHRFPFAVYYIFFQDKVLISSIIHSKRSPSVWKKRKLK